MERRRNAMTRFWLSPVVGAVALLNFAFALVGLGQADKCEARGEVPVLVWSAPVPVGDLLDVTCPTDKPVPTPADRSKL